MPPTQTTPIASFIRERIDEVLECWEIGVRRALPVSQALDHRSLRDELPVLLRSVADMIDRLAEREEVALPEDVAERHARARLEQGYDLPEVVQEYAILRECLVEQWRRANPDAPDERLGELVVVHRAIDQAISASVERYAQASARTLTALDRIATAAASSRDLDDLLLRILDVLQELVPAVDAGAVWLRDGDRLRVRAAVDGGSGGEGVEVAIGQGVAGTVAQRVAPLELRAASHDPLVVNDPLPREQTDALLALPMLDGGELLGVLELSSRKAPMFSGADRRLFDSAAARATSLMRQHVLGEAARRATQLREQVLAIVSHDLRSPLAAVRLAATVLERTVGSDARARKPIDAIVRSTMRMEHLINDLLDVSTLQAGMLRIDAKPLEPALVLAEAVAANSPIAAEKGIDLRLVDRVDEARVVGDAERLVQVLQNLIGNAVKFCKSGDTITVSGKIVEDGVQISVADTGPGIAADDSVHLFEQYWSANRHARHGAGLGLYICKGIVEAHGGRIWVDSTPGRGSSFCFVLPLARRA
ncbi:MAG TPA: ATP-binding protein [Nannocystaceae bacterium]|nr:ATP-binding protein [Nannocystaceae bacterium]